MNLPIPRSLDGLDADGAGDTGRWSLSSFVGAGLGERPRARWMVSDTRARNERRGDCFCSSGGSGPLIIASRLGDTGSACSICMMRVRHALSGRTAPVLWSEDTYLVDFNIYTHACVVLSRLSRDTWAWAVYAPCYSRRNTSATPSSPAPTNL